VQDRNIKRNKMTITTIADLINEFVKAEAEILNQFDINDQITIGRMYEGLTANVLNSTLLKGLNLKVVKNCFINGSDTEFDVMLVEGEGKKIPYSDRFIFEADQVIVVIQVKKNLYSKDIEKGYNNLKFLVNHYESMESEEYVKRLFRDSFKQICRKEITALDSGELTENEKLIFYTLWTEASLPVRIIWGYNGFKSEYNFRDSFYDYLSKNISTDLDNKIEGFGPHNFPDLIICGQYSMLKNNAMPFIQPISNDGWWSFYASSSYNPSYFFLELVWTRLSYRYEQLPTEIFGEDLDMQPANKYLDCRLKTLNGQLGWEYNNILIADEDLKANTEVVQWEPVELDLTQHTIIAELCKHYEIDLNTDKDLGNFIIKNGYSSLSEFINDLKKTGLVYVEKDKLRLLTEQCQCLIQNGKFYAADNKTGRLTNWSLKELRKNKK
jgi:hypothetical protein